MNKKSRLHVRKWLSLLLTLSMILSMGQGLVVFGDNMTGQEEAFTDDQEISSPDAGQDGSVPSDGQEEAEPAGELEEAGSVSDQEVYEPDAKQSEPAGKKQEAEDEEPAGTTVSPDGWIAWQNEGGEPVWSGNAEDGWIVTYSAGAGQGTIIYDPERDDSDGRTYANAKITISAASTVPDGYEFIVEGGLKGFPTSVSVDESLEGKVYINELSTVEDENGFTLVGYGKDQDEVIYEDTKEFKVSSTEYVSGTKVYDTLSMMVNGNVMHILNEDGYYFVLDYGTRSLKYYFYYYPAVTALKADGSTIANIPESFGSADISNVADLATNEFNDFYFRCEGQTFWLRTGKTGKAVSDVENRTFELKKKDDGGVYACVSGQETMAIAKTDKALRYGIEHYDDYNSSFVTTDLHDGNGEPLEFDDDFIAGYEVKLKAWCKGEGYGYDSAVSENAQDKYRIQYKVKRDGEMQDYSHEIYAFDSEHITKSAPIVYRASAPTDQLLYGISSNKTDFMLEYVKSAYKKGRANIAFLAADTGVSLTEIKELPVSKWTRAVDEDQRYDYSDYATVINKYYSKDGQLLNIENGKTYRIYARYFNPEDVESSAVGVLADLTAGDFSKEYVVLSPFDYHIPYDDSLEDESIITSYREGLVPDSYVDDGYHYDRGWWDVYPDCRFWIKAFSRDSMRFEEKVQAEGDFRIVARKVIEGEDEDRDKFLSANDIDEAKKYGCEVTEQYDDDDGWSIGEYDVLVFFYPNDETRWFRGVVHSENTRFFIKPTEINLAVSLKTGNGRYRDGKYIFSSGETISYEDLGFRLSGDTRKLDNKGESIPAKDIFDLDGEPEVSVYLNIWNSDDTKYIYVDDILKPGDSFTIPELTEGMDGYLSLNIDNTDKLKLKEKATGKDDPTYALITSHHGNSLRVGVVPKGTVSSALIKDSEITYGKVYKLTDSRKAMKYMKGLIRVSSNMTLDGDAEDVTENSVFLFAAAAGGPFVTAEKLDRSVFAVGGKIYVRPSYLGVESSGEPIELTITTQPVYIEAAVPIEVDKGGTAPATYSKDIFVRDLDADGRPDSETYSVYKNGPAPITDWHNSDSVEVDSSGLDTSESGSFKLGGNVLKINLKEDKAASFAVRSTGAFFVVRSGGSVIVDP
ncbi:MAG: hypothetical protein K5770_17255, partial [Lachnospiraceae bacterium]|nr:hypothetical protein [Lachnospiraceae bacterium]